MLQREPLRDTVPRYRRAQARGVLTTPRSPGARLREVVWTPLGWGVTEGAERLAMWGVALPGVPKGGAGISPDVAVRLERAGVSTARFWMTLQANYDLACAEQREQPDVMPLQAAGLPT